MEVMYTGNGWFTEVEKKPKFMDPEERSKLWQQTPLYEKPKWQRAWYYIFGWPKRFKPTGYKGNFMINKEDIKPIILEDCEDCKWRINIPEK